jgi:NtrC-family two-component system sensor histidine kinase KinB
MANDPKQSSLELLYNITRELSMSLDLRSVLPRILSLSMENVSGERGSIIVFDENGKPINGVIFFGTRQVESSLEELNATVEHGLAGWVVRNSEAALLTDTSKDLRWMRRPDDTQMRSGPKSAICVPLKARDHLVGALTIVHSQVGFFTNEHLELMQTIAGLAGISVENAQLFERLEQAQKRYRELFENTIDPILISDWESKILETNRQACRVSGYERTTLVGMLVADLHTINREKTGDSMQLLTNGSLVTYESELRTQSGATIHEEVYVHPTHIDGRDYLQWLLRDITERKNLAALQDDLTAMIYHDLRSPLANVISSLDMLRSMLPAGEDASVNSLLEIADHSTQRMQRLVSSLLDIRRIEAGQPINRQELVPLTSLINEACKTLQPLVRSRDQHLIVTLPENFPPAWVDEDMIRRVVINLLENASKYSPPGDQIKVSAQQEGDWVKFSVKDSGPGIPLVDQERIFHKFVRLKADGSAKGLGLGLTFCRLAINAHGGRIWVDSQPPHGSQFNFTLPLASTQ